MASVKDTASFFAHGNSKQFEYCLKLYPQVLRLKAEKRNKKPEELIRLDDWYQNELPKKIKSRGKDAHMVHEELVQTMKWKQSRGKFYPQLSYLVKVNTPRAVMQETKKAFRKLPNLEQAITALSNLKGVGTTMASALLAAAAPDSAPFMADECLMAIPEIEGIDYTTKEYLNFVQHIQTTVTRLNSEKDSNSSWSPHRVELALWTHYVASDLKPELLEDLPQGTHHPISVANGVTTTTVVTSNNATNDDDSIETTNDENDDEENNVCITKQKGLSTISTPSATTITPPAKEAESSVDSITGGEDISLPPTSVALEQPETAVVLTSLDADDITTPSDVNTSNKAPAAQQLNPLDPSDESNLEPTAPNGNNGNGAIDSLDESTRSEDSLGKPITPIVANDETNDSDSYSSTKRSLDCESYEEQTENSQPETKKLKPLE